MNSEIAALLTGPKSDSAVEGVRWLYQVHDRLASAPERSVHRIAPHIKAAALAGSEEGPSSPRCRAALFEAQLAAILCMLEELRKTLGVVVATAEKLPKASPRRKRAQAVADAYHRAIEALRRGYFAIRTGNAAALPAHIAAFDAAKAAAASLQ